MLRVLAVLVREAWLLVLAILLLLLLAVLRVGLLLSILRVRLLLCVSCLLVVVLTVALLLIASTVLLELLLSGRERLCARCEGRRARCKSISGAAVLALSLALSLALALAVVVERHALRLLRQIVFLLLPRFRHGDVSVYVEASAGGEFFEVGLRRSRRGFFAEWRARDGGGVCTIYQ